MPRTATTVEAEPTPELHPDVAKARLRQEVLRKTAPKGFKAKVRWVDPREELVRTYAPSAVGDRATHTAFFGDALKHNRWIDQGYEPVIYKGDYVKTGGGDILYIRPKELTEAHIKEAADRSMAMVRDGGADDETFRKRVITPGLEMTENETEVTKGPLPSG